jgi:hypothetical protein
MGSTFLYLYGQFAEMKITTVATRMAMGVAIQQVRTLILPVQNLVSCGGLEVVGAMARAAELFMKWRSRQKQYSERAAERFASTGRIGRWTEIES